MLSKKAKYAIKAIEYLTKQDTETPVQIAEIASEQGIPKKFLEAILLELKRDGLLRSRIGKNGGYFLNRPANEITLGHVIRLIDGPIALVPCVSMKYYQACDECPDENLCGLKLIMAQVRESTGNILEKVTFSDLLKNEQLLHQKKRRKKN